MNNLSLSLEDFRGTNIEKSFNEVDLEKAEGDRGGKVIGHTKSGKPIYDSANHEAHKNFSAEDHQDAISAHSKLHSPNGPGKFDRNMPKEEREAHKSEMSKHIRLRDKVTNGPQEKLQAHTTESGKKIELPKSEKGSNGEKTGFLDVEGHKASHKDLSPKEHEEAAKFYNEKVVPHYEKKVSEVSSSGRTSSQYQDAHVQHSGAKDIADWHSEMAKK